MGRSRMSYSSMVNLSLLDQRLLRSRDELLSIGLQLIKLIPERLKVVFFGKSGRLADRASVAQ